MGTAKKVRSAHAMPRGGYRIPTYVLTDMAERDARQKELDRQYEEDCKVKVGADPSQPWHPLLNPSEEDVARQEQSLRELVEREKLRKLNASQEQYRGKALALIRSGSIKSYADLGQRFTRPPYGKHANEPFTGGWAYLLVQKLLKRNEITREEIERLIPDRTSPFKRRKDALQG